MRRRVFFHGPLKELCPDPVEIDAETVADAIKGITFQLPEFNQGERFKIAVVGVESIFNLFSRSFEMEEIHIVPQFAVGKSEGVNFVQIVVGAALIAASFFVPGMPAVVANILMSIGSSLVLGGVTGLLMAAPQAESAGGNDVEASKYLGSPRNTTKIGTRIPILAGRDLAFGHFLSFDIDAKDVAV